MSSVLDVWRVIDPTARLLAGTVEELRQPVRGVSRTRAAPPHLPPAADGHLLVVDAASASSEGWVGQVLDGMAEADIQPAAVLVAGVGPGEVRPGEVATHAGVSGPLLASELGAAALAVAAEAYLSDAAAVLDRLASDLRLRCAEAALADPDLAVPAGLVAERLRRGVAVTVAGELRALLARPAGRAQAAAFAALHRRLPLLAEHGPGEHRRQAEGLWLLERRILPDASVWLFDNVPLAAADEVGAEALAHTLRALLRRGPEAVPRRETARGSRPQPTPDAGPMRVTLIAVARANGRVAPAARALGVHRNTVLYRLRRASHELGLDPRRPADALRILAEAGEA